MCLNYQVIEIKCIWTIYFIRSEYDQKIMTRISTLTLQAEILPYEQANGFIRPERRFLDFVVNGISLWKILQAEKIQHISCLWLPTPNPTIVRRLLGKEPPDLPEGRCALYVCHICGQPDCGVISVFIEVQAAQVIWSRFSHQTDRPRSIKPMKTLAKLEPMTFDLNEYRALFKSVLALKYQNETARQLHKKKKKRP